jgi:UDP-3-O-[3-hydroxymyristoyl] glucosamine N-acyltransferase
MNMPEYKLSYIAREIGMTLKGDDLYVTGLNTLENAGPHELSFLANPKYLRFLENSKAGAIILSQEYANNVQRALVSDMPYRDFGRVLTMFARKEGNFSGISKDAFIHPEASLGKNCSVYPFAYIGPRARLGDDCVVFPGVYIGEDCKIGSGCTFYPNAVLMSAVEMGHGCIVHPGVVLGAEGFGFTRVADSIQKIPQAGCVRLGNRVEIGANSTIDRGVLGPTLVGDDNKLDNLVQIGHNVVLGKQNLIVAQVGIAGSTQVGDENTLAGQVGISGHLKIGSNTIIGPQAGIAQDVPDNFSGSGHPLMEKQTYLRCIATLPKLPSIQKTARRLEKELEALKSEIQASKE